MATFCQKYTTSPKSITKEGIQILQSHHWPGNIRQLKNLIEKLVVLSDSEEITANEIRENLEDFSPVAAPQNNDKIAFPDNLSLEAMEEKFIKKALKKTAGNQRKAAKLLDISRDALRYRLKKMDIPVNPDEDEE